MDDVCDLAEDGAEEELSPLGIISITSFVNDIFCSNLFKIHSSKFVL